MTGDRPTGPLHLGHYVGSLESRIAFQSLYESYILIADTQALTDNFEEPERVHHNVYEVLRDYIAVGIDPHIATIFVQSQVPQLTELTSYFMNLVTVSRLERNPTVKAEIQQKGFGESLPAGFFCYPISQAADIAGFKAHIVPVGEDQLPMIEQCNEIVRRFNRIYKTDCLVEAQAYLGRGKRLTGIDGQSKASKSLGNAIFLSDSKEEVKRKVFAMFTDPNHLRVSDPGAVEGNVVFSYLDIFDTDTERVADLKAHYQRGGLGDTTLKTLLTDILEAFLAPIREKRALLTMPVLKDILHHGNERARRKVEATLSEVREAMHLVYD